MARITENLTEEYLESVRLRIGQLPDTQRDETLERLAALLDFVASVERDLGGVSEEDALRVAFGELGNPEQLGERIAVRWRASHRSSVWQRAVAAASCAVHALWPGRFARKATQARPLPTK